MIWGDYPAYDILISLDFDLLESISKFKFIQSLFDCWPSQLQEKLSGDINMNVSVPYFCEDWAIDMLSSEIFLARLFLEKQWILCWG